MKVNELLIEKVDLSAERQKVADVVYDRGAGGSVRNWLNQNFDKLIAGSDLPHVRGGWLGGKDYVSKKLKNLGLSDEQIAQIRQAAVDASVAVMDWMKRRHPDAKFSKMIYKDPENFGVFQVYGSWEEGDDDKYFAELPNTQGFRNEFRGKVEELFKLKLRKLPDSAFKPLKEGASISAAPKYMVMLDGKVVEAIPIESWTAAELATAAAEGGVGIKGLPRRKAEAMVASTARHYLIRDNKKSPLFVTRAWVQSNRIMAVKEEALAEGYEAKVLQLLKDAGVTDCYFEKGTLVCAWVEDRRTAKEVLKQAYPAISKRPPIVVRP